MSNAKNPPGPPQAPHRQSLATIKAIVDDPAAFRGGQPQWKSTDEIDRYLTAKGFRLTATEAMGPKGLANGQQLIYEGPSNVIVKVKTRGYNDNGPPQRVGVATMSIEATDGKGSKWDNVLFKVDSQGKIVAKNITAINEEVVRLPPDHPARRTGEEWGVKNPRDGSVRPFAKFEVIQGGGGQPNPTPINKQAWADSSHMNLPRDFNPDGADRLASKLAAPPKPAPAPAVKPVPRPTRIRGIVMGVGAGAATVLVGMIMGWLRQKVEREILDKQLAELAPEITSWLHARKVYIAELQAADKTAYANVSIEVVVLRRQDRIQGPQDTMPMVDLKTVDISNQDINQSGRVRIEAKSLGAVLKYTTPYTYSFEVSLPDTVLNEWKETMALINDAKAQLSNPRLTADERRAIEQQQYAAVRRLKKWVDAD